MAEKTKQKRQRRKLIVPKNCYFCEEKTVPWYNNTNVLQKFLSERGKISGSMKTGVCAKHQRRLTSAIKHARHLALLPFVNRE